MNAGRPAPEAGGLSVGDVDTHSVHVVDGRRNGAGYMKVFRGDLEHPNARQITGGGWMLYLLIGTYCDGNEAGWKLDRDHIAKRLGVSDRTVTRFTAQLRDLGYLQTYRRTLPKMDAKTKKWLVGPANYRDGRFDVQPGLEGCMTWELRTPWHSYPDGPDEVVTQIVDNLYRFKPGEYRVLNTVARWRVPDVGGGKEADGRVRQAGVTLAELAARGWCPGKGRRVRPIATVTADELRAVVGDVGAAEAGIGRTEGGGLLIGMDPESALKTWRERKRAGAGQKDPARENQGGTEAGQVDPAGLDRFVQPELDPTIQPTSLQGMPPNPSSRSSKVEAPPAPLGSLYVGGRSPAPGKAEAWMQLCEQVGVVLGLCADGSPGWWPVALADTRSHYVLNAVHDRLIREHRTIARTLRHGPYSTSEAIAEVRRAWVEGAWEIPADASAREATRGVSGDTVANMVRLADAWDEDPDQLDDDYLGYELSKNDLTLRNREALVQQIRAARQRLDDVLDAEMPPRAPTHAAAWARASTCTMLREWDVQQQAVMDAAGVSLERVPWPWRRWLATVRRYAH